MAKSGYHATTEAAVALVAATPKTVLGVKSPAGFGVDLKKYRIGFDGVTATAVPVLIEVCRVTYATNAPGTNSTSVTVDLMYGRNITAGFTAARAWTVEPTVLTVVEEYLLTPNGGTVIYDYPLDASPDCLDTQGFAIRLTAPANVNCRATLWFERA